MKQVRFRRQRVIVEAPPEDPGADDSPDEADDALSEKIEVHVHVHRGERTKSRSKRRAPPALTGTLFDWDWYKERLLKRPRSPSVKRWSFDQRCPACDETVPAKAQHCPRCGAPRSRPRFFTKVRALLGLVCVIGLFVLCSHLLGDSVPEHRALPPLGQWTEEEYVIVEVPTTPSPFSYTPPAAKSETENVATR